MNKFAKIELAKIKQHLKELYCLGAIDKSTYNYLLSHNKITIVNKYKNDKSK